jgi:DNA-binding PadR family transcriptional regulator
MATKVKTTQYELDLMRALGRATVSSTFTTTTDVATFFSGSVGTVGKGLLRLKEKGFVVAKATGTGTQRRYQWRLSAAGQKVVG